MTNYTKEQRREIRVRNKKKVKAIFFAMYGASCECCGENTPEFLTLEHKQGFGKPNRHKLNRGSTEAYRSATKSYRPELYGVLCYNCNLSRGFFGYCPHEN